MMMMMMMLPTGSGENMGIKLWGFKPLYLHQGHPRYLHKTNDKLLRTPSNTLILSVIS